ncbi:MAG: hypothetical protein WA579_13750, partial [Rhodomicrobium sp.]
MPGNADLIRSMYALAVEALERERKSLSLSLKGKAVGNGMTGNGKALAIITGANQGGKTVFLRSIGLAQLMMQAGMFVGAEAFSANVA